VAPSGKASLLAFFLEWAEIKGWEVPAIHVRACYWLEHSGDLAVLRCFRGFGKSTLLAVYNAWRYYRDQKYRILHQGADDQMAYKTSRDTQHVLRKHPWTQGLLPNRPGPVEQWWVSGSDDERNASMFAKGITSTTTSSRADECQNDDCEVPKNISNPEAREKMRARLSEQVHIMVPGAKQLFVGTPHTHDSLYDEQEKLGADCLTIRMFEHEYRIENATNASYRLPFVPEMVFVGIGKTTRRLEEGIDFLLHGLQITFTQPPGMLVDFYSGSAWPERFDRSEMLLRRRKTRTIGEFDSQYQLHSKPVTEVRLNPEMITPYSAEPRFVTANKVLTLWLGATQIVGCALRWDPSSGKVNSDVSAAVLDLQDATGRHYWHRVVGLTGNVADTDESGRTITGGQVFQLCDLIKEFRIPRVTVETNGIGGYAPAFLKTALKQRKLRCGVVEVQAHANKNKRILEALEPPITSGMLWAHVSVLEGPLWNQMRDWNAAIANQPDDFLDAGAGAITDQPARIGAMVGIPHVDGDDDWRPAAGVFEAALED
jgi:hypothetical protein